MRILAICLLSLMLAGCTTTRSNSVRSHNKGPSTRSTMIIHQADIEPSDGAFTKASSSRSPAQGVLRHAISPGETLWSISKRYGVDVETIASANSINNSKSIEVGQILTIPGASSRNYAKTVNYSARRSSTFIWPISGGIVAGFGSKVDKSVNKGIDIRASEGANVAASRAGKVVYCDTHLKGFGQTVIIDHMDGFQTVYSYNADIAVKVGDIVEQRDVIARVGSSGRAHVPMLHFELRKNGEPLNPEFYLSR